jgi:hypothetical protein
MATMDGCPAGDTALDRPESAPISNERKDANTRASSQSLSDEDRDRFVSIGDASRQVFESTVRAWLR